MRAILVFSFIIFVLGLDFSAVAQELDSNQGKKEDDSTQEEIKDLQRQLKNQQQQIDQLQDQLKLKSEPDAKQSSPLGKASGWAASLNPKISLDGLFAAGSSTA